MKPTPIHLIVSRLKRLHLDDRINELVRLAALEKPKSMRRNDLLTMLYREKQRQIKAHMRTGRAA